MKRIRGWFQQYALFLLFFATLLVVLEVLVRQGIVPGFIIPAPTGVLQMIIDNWRVLFLEHLKATAIEFFIGFLITVLLGVSLAIGMFCFKPIEKVMYPAVIISQMIPIIALSPIFVLWFGYSIWSKVAVTVLISFFPIVVSTYDGLRACDKDYIELFRSMGGIKQADFSKVTYPNGATLIFLGL
ncbi:ABC transporter permease [Solibacillus silvestris]|uniref:ABC transporter permease n=1 Tax=Solibacillus silvestris TaxID=76853 RepID=UPI003F81A43C